MNYINNITEAIGNTPLLKLNKVGKDVGADVFLKLEHLNPSGSYKDRMALSMVEEAEKGNTWNGRKLMPDGVVVDASAGNTAPALAMICAAKGYKSRFFLYRYMFEGAVKPSRMLILQAYGPDVQVSSDPSKYLTQEEIEKFFSSEPDMSHILAAKMDCQVLEDADPKTVWTDQIYNMNNVKGQRALAKEIYDQLDGKIDAIGCSVASGGTLFGLCDGLRALGVRPKVTFGIVPEGTENYVEMPKDECNRDEFVVAKSRQEMCKAIGLKKWVTEPSILQNMFDAGYPDKFFKIGDKEARDMADRLCREEGVYCGMSSGANVAVALKIAARLGKGHNVVTTVVDRRDRYLSEIPNERYVV